MRPAGAHESAGRPFDELFRQEYATVVGIARRVLGETGEAEDVAQEVFYSFYRSHAPDAPYAAAWLHRAAAHRALNVVRGRRRRPTREQFEAARQERLAGAAPDPLHEVELAEQRREVRQALARLPEKKAAVLVLRHSGLSYAAIAAALGIGTGQVGTLLRRAEAALHKELIDETPR